MNIINMAKVAPIFGFCFLAFSANADVPEVEPTIEILPVINAEWPVAELKNGSWLSNGAQVPIKGPALKNAAKSLQGPVVIQIPGNTWSTVAIEALNNLHAAGISQVAIAVKQGEKIRYIGYCPLKVKKCLNKDWASKQKDKAQPALFLGPKTIEIGSEGLLRKKDTKSLESELIKLKERFAKAPTLQVSADPNTRFSDLASGLSKITFQNFALKIGKATSKGLGALAGFDDILGGDKFKVGDIGKKRIKEKTSVNRSTGTGKEVISLGKVEQAKSEGGPNVEKSRAEVDQELDEDASRTKLPKSFMKKVAERLRVGTKPIQACYMQAKAKVPTLVGEITVRFRVDKAGKVVSTEIVKNEMTAKSMNACVKSEMAKMVFPKPPVEGGVVLANTFVFEEK